MPSRLQAYQELTAHWRKISTFGSVAALLGWDQRTKMPPAGAEHRARQLSLMAGMSHELTTDPRIGAWIKDVQEETDRWDPESVEAVNVREINRDYEKATRLPKRLVEELAQTASLANEAWIAARSNNDFTGFQPWLEKIIGLVREKAEALGYEDHPYDALLDTYEPYATMKEIRAIFDPLKVELRQLIEKIAGSSRKPNSQINDHDFPQDAQEALSRFAANAIGFDFQAGRLDVTTHPFCSTIGPGDARLTTRYHRNHFTHSLYGTLHEAGHGIYGQGLDREHYGTPMGESVSLGIHESQSRMYENFVGRSRSFLAFALPRIRAAFPAALGSVELDDLYFAINESRPSLIRVEADEATYNLHIMLRFDIEVALIEGSLKLADLPHAWRESMKTLLGLEVPDNAQGCLQDIHWSMGGLGYFPTYALGNLYAAQFFEQAGKDLGDLDASFEKGQFGELKGWLNEKIHRQGRRYMSNRLCEVVTGAKLTHRPLMTHLTSKLGALYGI